jgi:N-acyl-L-homoserine lactone synthetase
MHEDVLQSFFKLRHRVFRERLGWTCGSGFADTDVELDEFDDDEAIYLLIRNYKNEVIAGLRLLRTNRRHILGDCFPSMLDNSPIRDPKVLEVTRFVVDPSKEHRGGNERAVSQLVWGLQSYGLLVGLSYYVSLSYVGMERILRAAGCRFWRLGAPQKIDGRSSIALKFEISSEILSFCKMKAGVVAIGNASGHSSDWSAPLETLHL